MNTAEVRKHLEEFPNARVLAWFSCGAASAVAAKCAVQAYGDRCVVLYCDTSSTEHPDNVRFMEDVAEWIGKPVKILRSSTYSDTWDVYEKTGYLVGPAGARCTTELKRNVRKRYADFDDVHVLGFTLDEQRRVARFNAENPELFTTFNLVDNCITKAACYRIIRDAGIALPTMYVLGFDNNNCIGCVKGGMGYWNKIRVLFPGVFARMATLERKMDVAILSESHYVRGKRERARVFLDELDPSRGVGEHEAPMDCGVMCISGEDDD